MQIYVYTLQSKVHLTLLFSHIDIFHSMENEVGEWHYFHFYEAMHRVSGLINEI